MKFERAHVHENLIKSSKSSRLFVALFRKIAQKSAKFSMYPTRLDKDIFSDKRRGEPKLIDQ